MNNWFPMFARVRDLRKPVVRYEGRADVFCNCFLFSISIRYTLSRGKQSDLQTKLVRTLDLFKFPHSSAFETRFVTYKSSLKMEEKWNLLFQKRVKSASVYEIAELNCNKTFILSSTTKVQFSELNTEKSPLHLYNFLTSNVYCFEMSFREAIFLRLVQDTCDYKWPHYVFVEKMLLQWEINFTKIERILHDDHWGTTNARSRRKWFKWTLSGMQNRRARVSFNLKQSTDISYFESISYENMLHSGCINHDCRSVTHPS